MTKLSESTVEVVQFYINNIGVSGSSFLSAAKQAGSSQSISDVAVAITTALNGLSSLFPMLPNRYQASTAFAEVAARVHALDTKLENEDVVTASDVLSLTSALLSFLQTAIPPQALLTPIGLTTSVALTACSIALTTAADWLLDETADEVIQANNDLVSEFNRVKTAAGADFASSTNNFLEFYNNIPTGQEEARFQALGDAISGLDELPDSFNTPALFNRTLRLYTATPDLFANDTFLNNLDFLVQNGTVSSITSLVGKSPSEIEALAQDANGQFALEHLLAFKVNGNLQGPQQLDTTDYTEAFISAKATMLAELLAWSDAGTDSYSGFVTGEYFQDMAIASSLLDNGDDARFNGQGVSHWTTDVQGDVDNYKKTIFGSAEGETIHGGNMDDRLFGRAGDDQIYFGTGNDYAEGGSGQDTYYYNTGDGNDTISDTDGSIVFDGVTLIGGNYDRETAGYLSADGNYIFKIQGNDLVINDILTIQDFNNRDLNISLTNNEELESLKSTAWNIDYSFGDFKNYYGVVEEYIYTPFAPIGEVWVVSNNNDDYRYRKIASQEVTYDYPYYEGLSIRPVSGSTINDLTRGELVHGELIADYVKIKELTYFYRDETWPHGTDDGIIYFITNYTVETYGEQEVLEFFDGNQNIIIGTEKFSVSADAVRHSFNGLNEHLSNYNIYNYAQDGSDQITGTAGNDIIWGLDGDDTIYAGNGNDQIQALNGSIYIDAGTGNDFVVINEYNQQLNASELSTQLTTEATVLLGDGNDSLKFDGDYVSVNGGEGNDDINILYAGSGALISFSQGLDTLTFNEQNHEFLDSSIIIDFGESSDSLLFDVTNGTGLTNLGHQPDSAQLTHILIRDSDENGIFISLGSSTSIQQLLDSNSGIANITYRFTDGDKSLTDVYQLILERSSFGTAADDTKTGTDGDDQFYGYEGDDYFATGAGNDYVQGGVGQDSVLDISGNETYVFNAGDGQDSIEDLSGTDTLVLNNINASDVSVSVQGAQHLVINNPTSGDSIVIRNAYSNENYALEKFQFADTSISWQQLIALVSTIEGTDNDDLLTGGALDETFVAGAGSDVINGGSGNDTYVFNIGDGQDVVFDSDGVDQINFGEGITATNIQFSQLDSLHIVIELLDEQGSTTGDKLTINNAFVNQGSVIERLVFSDGSELLAEDFPLSNSITGTSAGDDIVGSIYPDTIYGGRGSDWIRGNAGNDVIRGQRGHDQLFGNQGEDIIYGNKGNDFIGGGKGNDELYGNSGHDQLKGQLGDDLLVGAAGNDRLFGGAGSDTLKGGTGDDELQGGTGSDTYVYNINGGSDRITEPVETKHENDIDILQFGSGINLPDVVFKLGDTVDSRELIIEIVATGETIIIEDWLDGEWISPSPIQQFVFSDESIITADQINAQLESERGAIRGTEGSDNIDGTEGDDFIVAGPGNDYLRGYGGNDVYLYNRGAGGDSIVDSNGNDTIRFGPGVSQQDLLFSFSFNRDLMIRLKGENGYVTGDYIRVHNALITEAQRIENIEFSDGTTMDWQSMLIASGALLGSDENDNLAGTAVSDVIIGMNGNDVISGHAGQDTLIGSEGDDELNGGEGNDVYLFNVGDGNDSINDSAGVNKLIFGEGITQGMIKFIKSENASDIIIQILDSSGNITTDSITVRNAATDHNSAINDILFSNGHSLQWSNFIAGTASADVLAGSSYYDVISGGMGDDTIDGGAGRDFLWGDAGDDIIRTGSGSDKVYYSLGDGNDRIEVSAFNSRDINKLVFDSTIAADQISLRKGTGRELIIEINNSGDEITLVNWFADDSQTSVSNSTAIHQLVFADGQILNTNNMLTMLQISSTESSYSSSEFPSSIADIKDYGIDLMFSELILAMADPIKTNSIQPVDSRDVDFIADSKDQMAIDLTVEQVQLDIAYTKLITDLASILFDDTEQGPAEYSRYTPVIPQPEYEF